MSNRYSLLRYIFVVCLCVCVCVCVFLWGGRGGAYKVARLLDANCNLKLFLTPVFLVRVQGQEFELLGRGLKQLVGFCLGLGY